MPTQESPTAYRFGFVMEQNLGHRTHSNNLMRFVSEDPSVTASWMPIGWDNPGVSRHVPLLKSNWSARASVMAHVAVTRARRSAQFDALFYHTQVTALLSPRQASLPVVISLDATPINYDTVGAFYGHMSGGRIERVKYSLNRRAFHAATALVTWCQWAKDSLIADYGAPEEKITVIAPGVDLQKWPRRSGRDRARASENRLPRLLFVGGDFERKGGKVLLDCFFRYLQEDCELSIVTQTPIPPAHHLHVYNNVTPNSDTLVRLYADADIFVFPTLADCAPLAVPEAMAATLPIVTTHVGAIPEMVRDDEQGYVVEPGNVEELRIAIHRLMNSPHLRARLGDSGRALVERDYDSEKNAQRLLDLLKGVSAGRARTSAVSEARPVALPR